MFFEVLLQLVIWLGLTLALLVIVGIWLSIALFIIGVILERQDKKSAHTISDDEFS